MLPSASMPQQSRRRAAVAGSWYPDRPGVLRDELSRYLESVSVAGTESIQAIIAPHAGLLYSGPVAAHAYAAVRNGAYDLVILVGPSHYVAFDGVAAMDVDAFETPLGDAPLDRAMVGRLLDASPVVTVYPPAHQREHSLEMQLPFLRTVLPDVPIVPLVMGFQTRETITALADVLAATLGGRRALLVASSDLSHFFDSETAARLDARVAERVEAFDPDGLLALLEEYPDEERGRFVACGGGPIVSVMRAARALGATRARVLCRADSGDISGDRSQVVGYMAASMG